MRSVQKTKVRIFSVWNEQLVNKSILLTNCEVHTGNIRTAVLDVRTERNEVRTKNYGPNIFPYGLN